MPGQGRYKDNSQSYLAKVERAKALESDNTKKKKSKKSLEVNAHEEPHAVPEPTPQAS